MATKTRTVSLRLTENEYECMHQNASMLELSISEFLRYLIQVPIDTIESTKKESVLILDNKTLDNLNKELTRWGRHYNQGIHALNTVSLILRKKDPSYETLLDHLSSVETYLDETEQGRKSISKDIKKITSYTFVRR